MNPKNIEGRLLNIRKDPGRSIPIIFILYS